jgi:hypothetical protein
MNSSTFASTLVVGEEQRHDNGGGLYAKLHDMEDDARLYVFMMSIETMLLVAFPCCSVAILWDGLW